MGPSGPSRTQGSCWHTPSSGCALGTARPLLWVQRGHKQQEEHVTMWFGATDLIPIDPRQWQCEMTQGHHFPVDLALPFLSCALPIPLMQAKASPK